MDLGLQNKVAIVTGASKGIGRAIAQTLAHEGMRLVVVARSRAQLDELASSMGDACLVQAADLTNADAPAAVVAATMARCGRLDLLVNNAGSTKRGDFLTLSEADWADGFGLKFYAAVRLSRAAWPHLQASSGGIINIIGIGGHTGSAEFAIGGAVNAALMNLTKVLADERGGRPAPHLVARFGQPEEIARLVAFLASPQAAFCQGAIVDADGGQTRTL